MERFSIKSKKIAFFYSAVVIDSFVALALIVLCLNRVFEGKLEKKFFSISTGVTT